MKSRLIAKIKKTKSFGLLKDGVWTINPINFQVLGICSALAVTVQMKPAMVMTLAVISVMVVSNSVVSIIRELIPNKIRIVVYLTIIASSVIFVDQILKAYMYDISRQLSVFVGLIITNCIIMGRAEAFAIKNSLFPSIIDGIANGLGYGMILCIVAFIRELFGSGSVYGIKVIPSSFYDLGYRDMGLMVLPAGAFIILGLIVWLQKTLQSIYNGD